MSKAIILGNGPSLQETDGWGRQLGYATVYGVNRSYDVSFHHSWVTADENALMAGIERFNKGSWPIEIVTTVKALNRVAENWGVVRYKTKLLIFPSAGFSGTLAMRAAALAGHDDIYLVGFDGGDGKRFYDKGIGDVREEFGQAYTSLRDMIVEAFPKTRWHLWDGDKGYQEYSRVVDPELEGWVRAESDNLR
jgi:hypothetical protein